jgi:hypothetical protein
MHVEAYKGVLRGLASKKLIEAINKGQGIRITDAGMRLMGIVQSAETKTDNLRATADARRASPSNPRPRPPASATPSDRHRALQTAKPGILGRVAFIAIAASAVVLLWWLLWPR